MRAEIVSSAACTMLTWCSALMQLLWAVLSAAQGLTVAYLLLTRLDCLLNSL